MLTTERRQDLVAGAAVALAALLPFLPGLLAGEMLFFRDLSLNFFPLRRFVVLGLREGTVRWWNPFIHEGEPLSLPALGYPGDLLQALWPDERFFSLLLALHLPLGAAGAFALGRALGLARAPAAAAGVVYGLGGFALSTVNLYVYCQALGWASWAVRGLLRASERGPRAWPAGALPVALCASTTGVEILAQALLAAPVLAGRRKNLWAMAAVAALGLALAAAPLLVMTGLLPGTVRARGFTTDVVLGHSVHPLTLAQALVSAFHGDPGRVAERWWGQNFFPMGFPYVLSLYLGASALALAAVGAARGGRLGLRLAGLAGLALLVCLGQWVGWGALLDLSPSLRPVRFPTKAYYTVHLATALLAALGLDTLLRAGRGAWRALAAAASTLGLALAAAPLLPHVAPRAAAWFAAGFFHPDLPWPRRAEYLAFLLSDAAMGGAVALAVAALAVAAARERLRPAVGAVAVTALLAADLLRAGAGLNPTLPRESAWPSPQAAALASAVGAGGQRVFTCDVGDSPAYLAARAARGERHRTWSLWTLADTFTPALNVVVEVPSAYTPDLTMLVPEDRVPRTGEGCAHIGALLPRLRQGAVGTVLSLDALPHEDLALSAVVAPPRLAPLRIHVYRLKGARPRAELAMPDGGEAAATAVLAAADGTRVAVDAPRAGTLVLRDAMARGVWARVNGRAAAVSAAESRYRAVPVPAGRSEVVFGYTPPGLWPGTAVSAAAALALLALAVLPRLRARRARTGPAAGRAT